MKKWIALLLITALCMTSCAIFEASWDAKAEKYYSDQANFVERCAVITHIQQSDEGKIYITVEQLDGFSDVNFKLDSVSSKIAKDNGFLTEVKVGDEIMFASAPRYFGDGYVYPVVSLSKGDKVYLSFDVGYENLMKEYE
jgi:hypothetical protein